MREVVVCTCCDIDQGKDLQEFFDSTVSLFKTPYGKSVIDEVRSYA